VPLLPKPLCSLQAAECATGEPTSIQLLKNFLLFYGIYYPRWCTVLFATIHIISGKMIFLFSHSLRTVSSDWLVVSHFMIPWRHIPWRHIPWRHIRISSSSTLTKTKLFRFTLSVFLIRSALRFICMP